MAEETITLPKSGVVLRANASGDVWELVAYPAFNIDCVGGTYGVNAPGVCLFAYASRERAVEELDERILAFRSALLPSGSVVVEDSPETVERVAQALMTQDAWNPKTLSELDDSNRSCHQAAAMRFRAEARAVLAALREARP